MLKKLLLTLIISGIFHNGFSQITINNQDLPAAGDTFRVSNGLITPAIDPIPTGSSHLWDFSMLQWISQDVDSFVTVSSTGVTYAFVFADLPFNSNRANQATKGMLNIPPIPLGGITVSDVVSFYYKSSTSYRQSGYGASINGIGVPIPFDNKDIVFELPLNYGDTFNCFSDFQLSIPNLGYYGHEQIRTTEVDGWGTLITPYGTFNTLRTRSVITPNDTVFLDTLGIGFGFNLPATIEYKWLALQEGIPLLQINSTESLLGGETVTSIKYRDSLRTTTGLGETTLLSSSFNLYPNPSNGQFTLEFLMAAGSGAVITLYSIEGKKVADLWKGELVPGLNKINMTTTSVAAGSYILEVVTGSQVLHKRMVIGKN